MIENYKVKKNENEVVIELVEETLAVGEKVCDIPRFLRVSNNCGISYNDPRTDSKIKELLANLPDGNYVATFDYQWYRGGWASGSNWYGEAIFKSESR